MSGVQRPTKPYAEAMNIQETIDRLVALKLKGMAEAYKGIAMMPLAERPDINLAVAKMVEAERVYRDNERTQKLLKSSKLRYHACLEDIECSQERNLTKAQLAEIADCSFIRRAENILITGLTGCGKSFLSCALGNQACFLGMRTEYWNMNRFIEKIALAKLDGTFLKVLSHLDKSDLLILDDFGLQPLDANSRLALLQILEDRYERKSMIIVSQLPLDKWYDYIAEPTLADAIMDRLVSNATHIELKGESMRRRKKK
jgi:DNA replication protein DnaC